MPIRPPTSGLHRLARTGIVVASVGCLTGCATVSVNAPSGQSLPPTAVVATIPVGRPPTLLAATPAGSRVFAASSGKLFIIRTDTNAVVATVPTSPDPTGVTVTPDGLTVLVNSVTSAQLAAVDATAGTALSPIPLIVDMHPGGFGRIAISPDGRRAYSTNQPKEYVALTDLGGRSTTELTLDLRPSDVTLSADGRTLFVTGCKEFCTTGTVEVIDVGSRQLVRSFDLGPAPYRFALSPDGTRAYATNLEGPSLSIVDVGSGTTIATVPVGVEPTGLAVSSDGTQVYVVAQQGGTLTIVDTKTNTVHATFGIADRPREIIITPDGRRAYVSTADAVLVLDTQRL